MLLTLKYVLRIILGVSFLACGQVSKSSVSTDAISPTIYYTPVMKVSDQTCDTQNYVNMLGAKAETLIKVCPSILKSCSLQGACFIEENNHIRRFNFVGRTNGQVNFAELGTEDCQYGYGVQNICLDPFYSVAADLAVYSPGDVIYIPMVVGLALPDGTKHSGYFIVSDQGAAIRGPGRFDFFTGFLSAKDPSNPFLKLKLQDKNTHVPYTLITGAAAEKAKTSRHYPQQ
jgi:3D (Asp-Asp-Asp) domain-containing protein